MSDRLRTLIDAVLDSLDEPAAGDELAHRVHLSRFHFGRLVSAATGESPAAFRRRLLLERAAWRLRGGSAVLDVAHDAGYASAEAFARSFRRAFGAAPSTYRGDFRLAAPNGIHYHPPGGLLVPGERSDTMDLGERLVEHDLWLTERLLAAAATVCDRLDEPVTVTPLAPYAFPDDAPTVRAMLDRLIFSKETWTAAVAGADAPPRGGTTLDELRTRFDRSADAWRDAVRTVRERGSWDTAFVDATCDPPESFTYGGMVAHVLSWSAHRRHVAVGALLALGATDVPSADPIAWERRAA